MGEKVAAGGWEFRRWSRGLIPGLCVAALLAGCEHPDNGLSRRDYNDLRSRVPPTYDEPAAKPVPPIPDLQPILAAPPPPGPAQRLVTISVTDPTVPLRDVLVELARKVGVDVNVDPAIEGGVIIAAKDRPFLEVVDRICDQANLHYSFKDNVLTVEVDRMIHQTYHVDVLNLVRNSSTDMATSTDIYTAVQGSSNTGNNTSTSEVKSASTMDPWAEIQSSIGQILYNSNPRNQPVLSNLSPAAQAARAAAAAQPASAQPAAAQGEGGASAIASAVAEIAGKASPAAVAAPAAQTTPAAPTSTQQASFSLDKRAGIISVFGTTRQQKQVKDYLDKVIAQSGTQVLIEAKVVEIALNDQFNTGVDWQALRQNLKGTGFGISSLTPSTNSSATLPALPKVGDLTQPFGNFGLNAGFTTFGGDLAAMINMVKAYGNTRTLSSPRLTVMNNHTAVMKVAQNQVYFSLTATVTSTPSTTGGVASQTATYSSTLHTVPIGLVMSVQPSIDLERNQVTLSLRPTVTAATGTTVSDPAVSLSLAAACGASNAPSTGPCSTQSINTAITNSAVPVIDVREMDSVVTVPSGDVVVMGGLMQEMVSKQESGVPGASEVPVMGNLFKANDDNTQLTELVIFLKATVVHGSDSVDWADKDTYHHYMHDPRPLGF